MTKGIGLKPERPSREPLEKGSGTCPRDWTPPAQNKKRKGVARGGGRGLTAAPLRAEGVWRGKIMSRRGNPKRAKGESLGVGEESSG